MTLTRESRLVRWAFLWEERIPVRVSLCNLFWRIVLFSPVKITSALLLIGMSAFAAAFLGYLCFLGFVIVANVTALLVILSVVAWLLILASWGFYLNDTDMSTVIDEAMATEAIQLALQVKKGICPIIEIDYE